jgi:alkylhydroperoxidase family enzyme
MHSRVEPAQPPFAPEIQALIDRITPPGAPAFALFTTLARDPRLFERFAARGFLGRGHLTLRQREIIVDRVTAQCGSEYEWGLHVAFFAEELGFGRAELRSLVHGGADDPCWSREDRLLIRLCDSLHDSCDVDDALWGELIEAFTVEALIEAMMIAGNYRAVAYLTNALRLPLETFGKRFPSADGAP